MALGNSDVVRVVWGELNGDLLHLESFEEYRRGTSAIALNDCKSLADALKCRIEDIGGQAPGHRAVDDPTKAETR